MEADPFAPLKARENPMKLMAASLLFTTSLISTIFTLLHVIITTNLELILPQETQKVRAFSLSLSPLSLDVSAVSASVRFVVR